jgi:hypothetical protein
MSKATIDLLKNFSTINGSILVKAGSKLETISATRNILASAEVGEMFETDFGIYDLNEFLNVVTSEAFDSAEFEFQEKSVILKIDETDVYEPFSMNMKIENLKIIGGDYTVSLASKGIAHFKNDNMPVEYFIAMADSTYGEQ